MCKGHLSEIPLHVYISDSELRGQSAEQRALKAEESLQAALDKIQDLERQLQGQSSLEPKRSEGTLDQPKKSRDLELKHRDSYTVLKHIYVFFVLQSKRKHHHQ